MSRPLTCSSVARSSVLMIGPQGTSSGLRISMNSRLVYFSANLLMWTLINKFAEKYTKREFMEILNPLDVPCGPIMSTEDLATDEHVKGRDMWVELDHPQRGKWYDVGMPIKLSGSPAEIKRSPLLGEHTNEVLKEVLGYDDAKIGALRQAGAFS